jgi:hypothetical protein
MSATLTTELGGPSGADHAAPELGPGDRVGGARGAHPGPRLARARQLEERGMLAEAAELYERSIWTGARDPALYQRLAAVYRRQGRDDLAQEVSRHLRRPRRPDEPRLPVAPGRAAMAATERPATAGLPPPAERRPSTTVRAIRRALAGAPRIEAAALRPGAERVLASLRRWTVRGREVARTARLARPTASRTRTAAALLAVGGLTLAWSLTPSTSDRPREAVPSAPVEAVAVAPPSTTETVLEPPAPDPADSAGPAATLRVVNVGGAGLSIRRAPGTGARITVLREGTELSDLGEQSQVGGRPWRKVRDSDGTEGWVAAEFLADRTAAPDPEPAAQATVPPVGDGFPSGGLGLRRGDWEQRRGPAAQPGFFFDYEEGRFSVAFLEDSIFLLQRIWTDGAVPFDVARTESKQLMPGDARLAEVIDRGSEQGEGRVVDLYTSQALGARFPAADWKGIQPGTFAVRYRVRLADGRVTAMTLQLGDGQ